MDTHLDSAGKRSRFMGIELMLGEAVLVPRAETELLAAHAATLLKACGDEPPIVIDMCCGSGNLALALATVMPTARIYAADLTDGAVETARLNVARLGLGDRVSVHQGDLFGALAGEALEGRVAMVVCNPPYISTGRLEGESAHLLDEEPREAFDGGPYGIAIQQRLVREAVAFLRPGGHLLFEFGVGQERQAASLLARTRAYEVDEMLRNEEAQPRVAVARLAVARLAASRLADARP